MIFKVLQEDKTKYSAWPNAEGLNAMKDHSFTQVLNVLQIDCAMHGNDLKARIGDSDKVMQVFGPFVSGDEGWQQKKEIAVMFAEAIQVSLKSMGSSYKKFYDRILKDYNKNGLTQMSHKPNQSIL